MPASRSDAADDSIIHHWIGVDGGGSRTRARLCDATGRVLAEGQAGPSALGQGAEQASTNIRLAVQGAVRNAGVSDFEWRRAALGLGLSGISLSDTVQSLRDLLPPCARLALDSDIGAGLLGAHGGGAGALLVAGTGSIAMARWPDGRRTRVGGWGWPTGDEGSGAWLGRAAVQRAQHAWDGRATRGPLVDAVLAAVGDTAAALIEWQRQAAQREYAALAPLVFAHEVEDPYAAALLADAVKELARHLRALDPAQQLPIAVAGGVGLRIATRLHQAVPARWVAPCGDAMEGALMLVQAPRPAS